MKEVWKWIDGYTNMYQVSNLGRVRSIDRDVYCEVSPNKLQHIFGKVLKQGTNHKGYPIVYLSKDGKQKTITVHRLVAKAFIENPLSLPQVNHKKHLRLCQVLEEKLKLINLISDLFASEIDITRVDMVGNL